MELSSTTLLNEDTQSESTSISQYSDDMLHSTNGDETLIEQEAPVATGYNTANRIEEQDSYICRKPSCL